ncbi:MAG: hypothetical protein GYB33_14285 [Gammaproteobacteria bacterium]|nr:hypothetical protein [Gammaproteobacteria bacterium]
MVFQFEDYIEGYGGELKCPSCGGIYLHHDKVEVFERSEDAETGVHAVVENNVVKTDNNLDGNPSRRRHGLKIHFWCEGCKAKPVISLSQHKGNTWVEFK